MLIAAIAVVDFTWIATSKVFIGGWLQPAMAIGLLAVVAIVYSRVRLEPSLAEMSSFGAKWIAFTALGAVLTYLGSSLGFPLMDSAFARWDRTLGFDWSAWVDIVQSYRVAGIALTVAYASLLPQIVISIVVLSMAGIPKRNEELLLGAIVSLLLTTVVSTLLPAMGPWVYYNYGVTSPGQIVYATDVLALRGRGEVGFLLQEVQGILCFPSYHTVLAILITYAHRHARSFPMFVCINVLMLLSIPSEGGHYLVDMIAGSIVALVTLIIVRRTQRSSSV